MYEPLGVVGGDRIVFVLVRGECRWLVVHLFEVGSGGSRRWEVATMTAVLDAAVRDEAAARPLLAEIDGPPSAGFAPHHCATASAVPADSSALTWADSGHGSRPGAAPVPGPGARVVDLADVEVPVAGARVEDLVAMLVSVPVADVSDVALVNTVAAMAQVMHMLQAAQAGVIREIEARTVDALRHVPDELACALVCTRRLAET
ncbi:MAG: hypothetical protein ABWY33_02245, partial [Cellulomonas sp.]